MIEPRAARKGDTMDQLLIKIDGDLSAYVREYAEINHLSLVKAVNGLLEKGIAVDRREGEEAAARPEPAIYQASPWEIPVGDEQAPKEPEKVRLQKGRPGEYYYPHGVDHPRYVAQNPSLMRADPSLTDAGSEDRWYLYSDERLVHSFGTLAEVREWLALNADPKRLELE